MYRPPEKLQPEDTQGFKGMGIHRRLKALKLYLDANSSQMLLVLPDAINSGEK